MIVPGTAGVWMGWYLTRSLRRDEDVAMRIMAFVGMLAASSFAAVYVVAIDKNGARLGASALPNISFIVGIFLYVMLRFQTSPKSRRSAGGGQNIRNMWSYFSSGPQHRTGAPGIGFYLERRMRISTALAKHHKLHRVIGPTAQGPIHRFNL